MSALKIEHVRHSGGCVIKLTGAIDETLDQDLFSANVSGVVLIDLDGVNRITSYGLREWTRALGRLQHSWLGFVRARPAIVAQFNMVPNFACGGTLLSLYLPYVCEGTGKPFEVLVDVRRQHAALAGFEVPVVPCPDGGGPSEFDDIESSYLTFVAATPAPQAPPLVEQMLAASETTGSLKVTKDVLGDVTGLWLWGRLDEKDHFRRIDEGLQGTLYVSFGGLSSLTLEGIAKVLKFLKRVQTPLVLDQVPLEIAEAVVADAALSLSAVVCSLSVLARCPDHGSSRHVMKADALKDARAGRPLLLFCAECEKLCKAEFDPHTLAQTATLPIEAPGLQIEELIQTHRSRMVDSTTTASKVGQAQSPTQVGRYEVLRPLGMGGMAEVFLARQTGAGGFDRQVVMKRILPQFAKDPAFVELFLQEARLAARLSHPNVVQIFDVGEDHGHHFIVMELVRGWDLNAVLKACARVRRPFPIALAARVGADIARGLSAAHRHKNDQGQPQPIIHRDVSPHNVLVSADGQVKLSDFGIAKAAGVASHTPTSMLKGKPSYIAPELLRHGKVDPEPRSDLFAAGLVFYQLLTLTHPFRRNAELATFKAVMSDPAPPPSTLVPGMTAEVNRICQRVLEKDPNHRYQTALDFERDLLALMGAHGAGDDATLAHWLAQLPELNPTASAPQPPPLPLDGSDKNTKPER